MHLSAAVDEAAAILQQHGLRQGDRIEVETATLTGQGRLMPRTAGTDPSCIVLKLDSGYNIGIRIGPKDRIKKLSPAERTSKPKIVPPATTGKTPVAILGTGGTIASFVDYRTGAVHPAATAEELAFATPEIFDLVEPRAEVVFQTFSEDLRPADWSTLARHTAQAFERGARGVVIPHGTDTLSYTAAALAFMLRDLPGPVVLVGSQRSSDRPSTDAAANLTAACLVARDADLGEVVVVMHAGPDDDRHSIHRGVRVRKNHTSRRDAFESVNDVPIGWVANGTLRLERPHRPASPHGPKLLPEVEDGVGYAWTYPGFDEGAFKRNLGSKGIVLVGTGLGHAPRVCLNAMEAAVADGKLVVMASQCIRGRTNLRVYSTGRDQLARGVVETHDMLPEVALVKAMHCLATAKNAEEAAAMMATDQVGEMSARTEFEGRKT